MGEIVDASNFDKIEFRNFKNTDAKQIKSLPAIIIQNVYTNRVH